ncbi:hypothetical protein BDW62DRAFT_191641 [Aspergillus aurantiobrunneus]
MSHGIKATNMDRAVPEATEVPLLVPDSGEESEEDPKALREKLRIQSNVQQIMGDDHTPLESKVDLLTGYMSEKHKSKMEAERELREVEYQNRQLRIQVKELNDWSETCWSEAEDCRATIRQLQQALEAAEVAKLDTEQPEGAIPLETLQMLQQKEQELRGVLEGRTKQVSYLENNLMMAKKVIENYQVRNDQIQRDTSTWSTNLQQYTTYLTMEHVKLKNKFEEMNRHLVASRAADAGRWNDTLQQARQLNQSILQQQQQQQQQRSNAFRLAYGSLDRDMSDAFETDTQMTTLPDRYVSPVLIRMRRRLARTKTRARRPGSSVPRTARPTECRKGYSERRAASTYLQYRGGKDAEEPSVLKPIGRNTGIVKLLPRKRTRLEKGSDMIKRMEAVSEVRRLPPLPRSIRPRVSPNPYHRRDDAELAKLMRTVSMSDKGRETIAIQTETSTEAKLVTIARTVQPFIPRSKSFSSPRYLPKELRPLSTDERRHWAKVASKWTLGPEMTEQPTKDWTPSQRSAKPSEWSFSWSHVIIAMLVFLLFLSNLGTLEEPKVSWKEANRRPEDIVAKLRTPGQGDGKVTIIDFEVARWSDVDASVFG